MATTVLTIGGITDSLRGWSKRHGLSYATVRSRWRAGYPIDQLFVPLMRKYRVRRGAKFGRWTIIEVPRDRSRHRKVRVRCECGNEKMVALYSLRGGDSRSCGCWNRDHNRELHKKHEKSQTREYRIWQRLKRICYCRTCPEYWDFGGKGIKVHEDWRYDFEQFLRDVGPQPPDQHLVRLDPAGDFEPGNVRWAHRTDRADIRLAQIDDIRMSLREWSLISGVHTKIVWQRIFRSGWSPKNAVFTPPGNNPGDYDVMTVHQSLKKLGSSHAGN